MPFGISSDDPLLQSLVALGVLALFLVTAGILAVGFRIAIRRLEGRRRRGLAPEALRAVRNSLLLFVVLLGLFPALVTLPATEPWRGVLTKGWGALVVLQVSYALANVAGSVITWYGRPRGPRARTQFAVRVLPLVRRILPVFIYGVATLVALDTLGVDVSPLLGALGISGLAVALALQPTLANFFAGTYVLSDGAIQVGDYIELQGGPAGYVVQIGWRSTKLRTWLNNLVIVPNSVMGDTIVTNYQAPDPAMNVLVYCGVSYSSDLEKVQRVSLEVAQELLEETPEAVKEMDPWFGYERFSDSNVEFWLFLQAKDRIGSFVVTNELIKRLHTRFAEEGIEINYPVRKLVYADGAREPASETIRSQGLQE